MYVGSIYLILGTIGGVLHLSGMCLRCLRAIVRRHDHDAPEPHRAPHVKGRLFSLKRARIWSRSQMPTSPAHHITGAVRFPGTRMIQMAFRHTCPSEER